MTLGESDVERVARHLGRAIGLAFDGSRGAQLRAAVRSAAEAAGARNADDYLRVLGDDEAAFDDLVDRITVGETYFFRDPAQFDLLRDVVLPDVLGRSGGPVRVWSAGCGTGEEPYSLAIFLDQLGLADRNQIVATDLNRRALSAARAGRYRPWSLRRVGEDERDRWFHRDGDLFVLDPAIRRRVAFAALNLASPESDRAAAMPREIDVVVCRNVLIYFTQQAVNRAVSRLVESLAPGGWLLTAAADPLLDRVDGLDVVRTHTGTAYRRTVPVDPPRMEAASRRSPGTRPRPAGAEKPKPRPTTIPAQVDVRTPHERIRVLADSGLHREALQAVEAGIQSDPLDPDLHALHAAVLIELGRRRDAVTAARAAVYLDPGRPEAHALLAAACGDGPAARRSSRNAVRAGSPHGVEGER